MMNRRGLTIGIAAALAAAVGIWLVTARSHGPMVEGKALGATVKVISMRRCPDGWVRGTLEVTAPRTLPNGAKLVVDGARVLGAKREGGSPPKPAPAPSGQQKWTVECAALVPKDRRQVQVTQVLHIERSNKRVHVVFNHVRPDKLPVTGAFNGVKVELSSVCANQPMDQDWFPYAICKDGVRRGDRCFGVELRVWSPGVLYEVPASHMLRDSEGVEHRFPSRCVKSDGLAPGNIAVRINDSHVEKAVRRVSGGLADKMQRRRTLAAAEAKRREATVSDWLYAFNPIRPAPKWFSFEMRSVLPPEPEDEATVTLQNVPVR